MQCLMRSSTPMHLSPAQHLQQQSLLQPQQLQLHHRTGQCVRRQAVCRATQRCLTSTPHPHHQHQQQKQQQPGDDACQHHSSSSSSCTVNRRQLLLVAATFSSRGAASQASAAESCQLQESATTGLQWCDLRVGDGNLPIRGSFTKVNYTAKLASNGAVFDSTYQRKQPLIFKVGECEMVQAFDTAILGAEDIPPMREGGKRLVLARPGPMQRQGVKSLTWVTGLLDAIDEAGEPRNPEGGFNSDLLFELELMPKRRG